VARLENVLHLPIGAFLVVDVQRRNPFDRIGIYHHKGDTSLTQRNHHRIGRVDSQGDDAINGCVDDSVPKTILAWGEQLDGQISTSADFSDSHQELVQEGI
jgi:hypothetical protein